MEHIFSSLTFKNTHCSGNIKLFTFKYNVITSFMIFSQFHYKDTHIVHNCQIYYKSVLCTSVHVHRCYSANFPTAFPAECVAILSLTGRLSGRDTRIVELYPETDYSPI